MWATLTLSNIHVVKADTPTRMGMRMRAWLVTVWQRGRRANIAVV